MNDRRWPRSEVRKFGARLPHATLRRLDQYCHDTGQSRAAGVEAAVEMWLADAEGRERAGFVLGCRSALGLTQQEFAALVGVDRGRLVRLESSRTSVQLSHEETARMLEAMEDAGEDVGCPCCGRGS